jgi:competence protein ComEC
VTLVALAFAWTAGILLGHLLWSAGITGCATPGWPFVAGILAALASIPFARRYPPIRFTAVLVLATLLGAWRYTAHPITPCLAADSLARFHADASKPLPATVEGVIASYPEQRDGWMTFRLRAERLWDGETSRPVTGDLLVRTRNHPQRHFGDRLRVTGQIETPPTYTDFDYRAYLARQGIHSRMLRAKTTYVEAAAVSPILQHLYQLREQASLLLNRLMPEPSAALANGMLLGIESGIPQNVQDAFVATGTSHVIVISGSNIALLAGVLLVLLSRLIGRLRAVIPVIVAIGLYVLMVGAGPAAVRAGLMGVLFVGAIGLGRQSTAWVSLAAAAILMTALNPAALWDVGFQISFAATLGLILFSPWIMAQSRRAFGGKLAGEQAAPSVRALSDGLAATLAAQVLVIPVVLLHFGRFSLTSLVANALILPAQPPILTGGILTLLAGLAWEPLGRLVAGVPWLFLTYTTGVVELFAQFPFGVWDGGSQARGVAVAYIVVLLSVIGLSKGAQTGWLVLPSRRQLALIGAVALPAWIGVIGASSRPDGNLHITFLPSERSEIALLTLPGGDRVLIADAPVAESAAAGQAIALVVAPETTRMPASSLRRSGQQRLDPAHIAPHATIRLADGVQLERLGSAHAWMFALRYGAFHTIVPTTLDGPTQDALMAERALTGITLLKLPGVGTGCWPTERFLDAATPQAILWPTETTYPPSVAALLAERAIRVPGDAAIEVITDGKQFRLRQFTPPQAHLP